MLVVMAGGVGDRRDVAALAEVGIVVRVVGVGRDVRDIGARPVDRKHRAVGVVRVGPGARRAARGAPKALRAVRVGGRLDALGAQRATRAAWLPSAS